MIKKKIKKLKIIVIFKILIMQNLFPQKMIFIIFLKNLISN